MNGRVFSSPVAGFFVTHIKGSKCAMISRALSTSASPSRSRRGRVVSARLYSADGAGPNHVEVSLRVSHRIVGSNFDTMSRETTSQPAASKALPTDLVPQKSSRSLGIFKEQDYRQENSHSSKRSRASLHSGWTFRPMPRGESSCP